jgi:hypothetical protein
MYAARWFPFHDYAADRSTSIAPDAQLQVVWSKEVNAFALPFGFFHVD